MMIIMYCVLRFVFINHNFFFVKYYNIFFGEFMDYVLTDKIYSNVAHMTSPSFSLYFYFGESNKEVMEG